MSAHVHSQLAHSRTMTLPHVKIRPSRGLLHLDLSTVWQYRELIFILVWRDVKVRYKQTILGAAWAIFQPLAIMLIFTAVFSYVGQIPSDGLPYPVFLYSGLLSWLYISQALSRSTMSLVGEASLISKVYFPRLILPLSGTLSPLLDLVLAFLVYLGLMVWFNVMPTWRIMTLPLFAGLALLIALAGGLWLSALYVRFRDVGHIIPMFIQLWMFVSPIIYPVTKVPETWRSFYALNPVVSVIEGFRWALLPDYRVEFSVFVPSLVVVFLVLAGGLVFFRSMERTFADVI
ncbi:MAG TPA: ABC transporter permease [Nitrospiraceae bacterium]|nr:ABC transporter permease [Nitrospiraceae bacterium]